MLKLPGMLKGYGMSTELPGHLVGFDWGEPVQNNEHRQRSSKCTRNVYEAVAQGLPCVPSIFISFDRSIYAGRMIALGVGICGCWQAVLCTAKKFFSDIPGRKMID